MSNYFDTYGGLPENGVTLEELGDYLSPEDARTQVNNHPDVDSDNQMMAALFGLDKMKSFMEAIDNHNNSISEPELQIKGLRIYKSISPKYTYDSKPVDNVVLIPVTSDGMDVREIFPDSETELGSLEGIKILGNGRPCPKLCGTSDIPTDG